MYTSLYWGKVDVLIQWNNFMVKLTLLVFLAGERPFFCPSNGCEKTFSTQYSLKSHMKGHDNKGHSYSALLNHNGSEVCGVLSLVLIWAQQNSNGWLYIRMKGESAFSRNLLLKGKKSVSRAMPLWWGGGSQKFHQAACASASDSSLPPFHQVWWRRCLEIRGPRTVSKGSARCSQMVLLSHSCL